MSFNFKSGGTWRTLASGWVKVAGSWEQVQKAYVKVAGTWEQVYVNLAATADKSLVTATASGPAACGTVGVTDTVTVTATGGTAPYTYAWTRTSAAATAGPYTATAPTGNATAFGTASSVCMLDAVKQETWQCVVTDANSDTVTVSGIVARITWVDNR